MAYKLSVLRLAEADITEILEYKAQFYVGTADRFMDALERILDSIAENPYVYQEYEPDSRYRRAVAMDYLVFYKIVEDSREVNVYRVLSGKLEIERFIL